MILTKKVCDLYVANLIEKKIYYNLTLTEFVQRLLSQRCASFIGKNDKYLLLTRASGCSGFMTVGTKHEKPPLELENVLSYDEIKLSALLSISSYSELLNEGRRLNGGVVEKFKLCIEREAVVVGIIGARLTQPDVMEYQDIIIAKSQNTSENGYGFSIDDESYNKSKDYRRIWQKFYEESDFLYENVKIDEKRFVNTIDNRIFDNLIMKRRYTISIDTLLLESEARAKAEGKLGYIHVVKLGLDNWKATEKQEQIYLETFKQRVKQLLPKLSHIGIIHFAWFDELPILKDGSIFQSKTHPQGGIKCFTSRRNPASKIYHPKNTLLIISYAADANSLPGNEFWMKTLISTADSSSASTACSTLITEIHNPYINSKWVNGENLHIASEKYGVIHISDYAKHIFDEL